MQKLDPPRSAFGAPPQGGAASGPAEPVPRRLLGSHGWAALVAASLTIMVLIPLLNLVVPQSLSLIHI